MFERTKAFCDSFLELGLPGFDLAIMHKGECVLRYMNGYSDLENKIKINGSERYNIYSCSKVITCVAAMQLYEKGLFSLEDKLSDYMPEFAQMTIVDHGKIREATRPILVKHLFEMTAGFSYNCNSMRLREAMADTEGKCPTRETMKYLAKDPLLFEPGERWEYSLCHDVLAALVEVLSGERFEIYVKKHIFDVAHMDRSSFLLPAFELNTVAPQYSYKKGTAVNIGKDIPFYKIGSEYAAGGAGCISTVEDYIRFLESLRTYKLIKPETLALMTRDRLSDTQKATYWTNETHGYGLGVGCPKGMPFYTDFGWGGAACAYLDVEMENESSLYIGAHMLSSPAQGLRTMLYRFARAELLDQSEFDALYADIERLSGYKLTY